VRELLDYRDDFPILAETTYLINHSLGAMPAEAERRLLAYAETWKTRGVRAWGEGWWDMPLTVGDRIARLIGAAPGSVGMHQNVTVAVAVVLSCFDFRGERRRIVYVEGEFPSVRYLLQAQRNAEVVVVPDQEALLEALDERALLVPVSHVLFRTAEIQDVATIAARAHDVGAHVVLDAYQSVGTVPLDVSALGVARFLTGTPNVPALHAASAGYDVIAEVGVDRIRANSLRQTALLIALLDEAGFEVTSPREPARRGGTVTVLAPAFEALHRELAERSILCDFRPGVGLRLGPHFFTSDDELRLAVDAMSEVVRTKGHERGVAAGAARY
jgi:kynureninase